MTQLPTPGEDSGVWGDMLNGFLRVAHNEDGTLQQGAINSAGGYVRPTNGIPNTDLTAAAQAALGLANSSVQLGGDIGGTPTAPVVTKLHGTTINAAGPTDSQVLAYNSASGAWVPSTVSNTIVNDATTSAPGILQLGGDLGGTATSPTVQSVQGVSISGTPSSGQALIASSGNAATWSTVTGTTGWLNVKNYGAKGDGATDDTAAIQAAINAVPSAGGTVYLPAATYRVSSTITVASAPIYICGDGRQATTINFTGSGDCLRIYRAGSYMGEPSGGVTGLTINGSGAAAGSCGLHVGDVFQFGIDVAVHTFNGAGDMGVHFDNTLYWTEQLHGRIFAQHCSTGVMFDNSANNSGSATGSFDRANLDIYIDQGGDGVVIANGAFIADGHLGIYGNFTTATTQYAALTLTGSNSVGFSNLSYCDLQIGLELDDETYTAPYTIYYGSSGSGSNRPAIFACTGRLNFGEYIWTSSNAQPNQFYFQGLVYGDNTLSTSITIRNTLVLAMSNGAAINHGYAGGIQLTNGGNSYTGIIMQDGSFPGQQLAVINEGAGSITFADAGTSNVANGAGCVIPGNTAMQFIWNAGTSLWYSFG